MVELSHFQIKRLTANAVKLAKPVFERQGWQYFDGPPNESRLYDMVSGLIARCREEEIDECSCGRFQVNRFIIEDGSESIEVNLQLSVAYADESFLEENE